jgi:hypothetical protein
MLLHCAVSYGTFLDKAVSLNHVAFEMQISVDLEADSWSESNGCDVILPAEYRPPTPLVQSTKVFVARSFPWPQLSQLCLGWNPSLCL